MRTQSNAKFLFRIVVELVLAVVLAQFFFAFSHLALLPYVSNGIASGYLFQTAAWGFPQTYYQRGVEQVTPQTFIYVYHWNGGALVVNVLLYFVIGIGLFWLLSRLSIFRTSKSSLHNSKNLDDKHSD